MGSRTKALEQIDKLIGKNIRLQRRMHGTSQASLAEAIGVSAQQLQKYETGIDRVSASRLCQIAQALGVRSDLLLDGVEATLCRV